MSQWRLAQVQDIFFLDITAKSGISAFAPDFENVMRYKRGLLTEDQYTALYLAKMEQSKRDYPVRWSCFPNHPRLALACYCRAGVYCHRLLFRDLVKEHLETQGLQVVIEGELLKQGTQS